MQVKCYGPGLEPTGCIVNKPAEFTIDASGAGRGHLQIYAQVHFHTSPRCFMPHASLRWYKLVLLLFQDSEGFPIDIQITDNGDSTYFCVYIPTKPIKHTIIITWGEVNVPNSPFRVRAHCQQADFSQLMTFLCCCLSRSFINLDLQQAQPFSESSWPHFSSVRFHTFPLHDYVRSYVPYWIIALLEPLSSESFQFLALQCVTMVFLHFSGDHWRRQSPREREGSWTRSGEDWLEGQRTHILYCGLQWGRTRSEKTWFLTLFKHIFEIWKFTYFLLFF